MSLCDVSAIAWNQRYRYRSPHYRSPATRHLQFPINKLVWNMNKKTNSVDVSHFWSNLGWRSFTGLIPITAHLDLYPTHFVQDFPATASSLALTMKMYWVSTQTRDNSQVRHLWTAAYKNLIAKITENIIRRYKHVRLSLQFHWSPSFQFPIIHLVYVLNKHQ